MLTPAEFPERWKKVSGATILKYSLSSPLADGLSPSTAAALKEYGLPNVAGSWLEFGEYDYIEPIVSELEERNLYPIGRVGFFGLICVDKITDKRRWDSFPPLRGRSCCRHFLPFRIRAKRSVSLRKS